MLTTVTSFAARAWTANSSTASAHAARNLSSQASISARYSSSERFSGSSVAVSYRPGKDELRLHRLVIHRDGDVRKIVFKDDFVLRDAPDPKLAWGRNGYTRGTIFAKLTKLKGG